MCDKCAATDCASTGSRRRRLWDLPHQSHCPVVGVCFPLSTLRNLVNKALGGRALADDYEVHVGAVAECGQRNRLSELMHKDLEQRYATTVQAFKKAKSPREVAALWSEAIEDGDVAGPFWAALTHPRCDMVLQEVLLRDMHMLQHQAGAAKRVTMSKFNALAKENGVLARELGRAQERCTRVIAEKSTRIEHLSAELMQQRAVVIRKDAQIAFLEQDVCQLQAVVQDADRVAKLERKLAQLQARNEALQQGNLMLRQELQVAKRALTEAVSADDLEVRQEAALDPIKEVPITLHLKQRAVLCVGGRNGSVTSYREVIEQAGGSFSHHDGGLEDNHRALDSSLAAADLVICQTGCISHNAYWRVKDFCKRTGKQCVFVESPSTSSLARSLEQLAAREEASVAERGG